MQISGKVRGRRTETSSLSCVQDVHILTCSAFIVTVVFYRAVGGLVDQELVLEVHDNYPSLCNEAVQCRLTQSSQYID